MIKKSSATHGRRIAFPSLGWAALVVGLLPAGTAIVAVIRLGDRPDWLFWTASATGTAVVVAYAMSRAAGTLHLADALLLAALIVAAVGYAEGGRLARLMPGWQVIAWGGLDCAPGVAADHDRRAAA